ncbi:hypothetical protein [Archangium lansingense]|uniref:Uncharacterized protein n=1 Tax=Archangium lansingense TaxID=2995310 RepID=A0ABT4AA57_9BACT|nr:hypothetical protein [Archangium lansinium]MCY1077827.1 hypothetical protein [Archangium lansinium]
MQNSVPAQRRSWRLRGSSKEYEIIRAFELSEAEVALVIPLEDLQREFDGWLKFSQGPLRDMLGSVGRVPSSTNPLEEARQLKRLFTEVFQSQRLVALRREPRQPALGHLIQPAPTIPSDVVDAAELAKEPAPAPQASPARNVNVAQQDSCLSAAAQDGTPFCEVCDNIKRGITS